MFKKFQYIIGVILVLSLLLSACGSEPAATTTEEQPVATEAQAAPADETAAEPADASAIAQTDDVITVTPSSQSVTTFTRNFNPFNAQPLYPTIDGIYEPLMINNRMTGELTPWLATSYSWSDDLLTLTIALREGVLWSDGEKFTAADVAYTYNLMKDVAGLQGFGLQAVTEGGYLDAIEAVDDQTVAFVFNRIYTPGLYDIVTQNIVPEHIWKDVEDPVTYTNDNPVGTGPFTEIASFQDQVYEVDRNPNYWQEGKPYIKGLRVVGFSGNDTAATMFVNGDVDWTGQFFPNVQEAVIAQNPTDLHCWWPTVTSDQLFMVNTTEKPFDDPIMRKAISMAFNREQLIDVALQGASTPADVTGLSAGYKAWKVEDPTTLGDWTEYNPDKANTMLDEAGYAKDADGFRTNLDGSPIAVELLMVNGFSDWLAVAPMMKQQLEAIGLNVTINSYDVPIAFDKWMKGDFDMSLFFGMTADLPYGYYRNIMASETLLPIGEAAGLGVNMWRYSNPAADAALEKFATTGDIAVQKEAAIELQKIMADDAPIIPMWHAATFYCYNDSKITGWATEEDQYTYPMPIAGAVADAGQLILLLQLHAK